MCLRLCFAALLITSASTVRAELAIEVETTVLPRTAEFEALPVTLIIDDVLPSDYKKREQEENEWERLYLTLPDSKDADLPLHDAADLHDTTGYHPHFWYKAVKRTKRNNSNGNLTVIWQFVLKARAGHKLSDLLQGTPPALQLAVSYHHWEGEEYGEALLDYVHAFPRLDGVPSTAPQQVKLTPRHHRLHIDWHVPETVDYSNAQGKFPPAGVVAIVAAASDTAVDMTDAAMVFRPAAEGGDVPLDAECQLSPDCVLDCGDGDNIYFDLDKIKNIKELRKSQFLQGGTGVINDLQPGVAYRIILQYYPDGIKHSECLTAVPVENKTLFELNGADAAEREDLRCFVATAAWGSSRAVVELRWWRDNFLLTHDWGRAFTAFYYRQAPAVAAVIADNELLQALTRILLLVPLGFVLLCKYPLLAVLMLCGAMLACRVFLCKPQYQR